MIYNEYFILYHIRRRITGSIVQNILQFRDAPTHAIPFLSVVKWTSYLPTNFGLVDLLYTGHGQSFAEKVEELVEAYETP